MARPSGPPSPDTIRLRLRDTLPPHPADARGSSPTTSSLTPFLSSFYTAMTRLASAVKQSLLSSSKALPVNYQSIPSGDYAEGAPVPLAQPLSELALPKTSKFEYAIFMLLGVAM